MVVRKFVQARILMSMSSSERTKRGPDRQISPSEYMAISKLVRGSIQQVSCGVLYLPWITHVQGVNADVQLAARRRTSAVSYSALETVPAGSRTPWWRAEHPVELKAHVIKQQALRTGRSIPHLYLCKPPAEGRLPPRRAP
jgi:surface antigen